MYNHYNKNGEYTGSSVKVPKVCNPAFLAAIFGPLQILLFCFTPIFTAWALVSLLIYRRKIKKLANRE